MLHIHNVNNSRLHRKQIHILLAQNKSGQVESVKEKYDSRRQQCDRHFQDFYTRNDDGRV